MMQQSCQNKKICRIMAMAAMVWLLWHPGLSRADQPADQSIHQADIRDEERVDITGGFQQVKFIRSEIRQIRSDLEWLSLKIQRMEDSGRYVPERLHDSVAFKKSKIRSLEKLLERYRSVGQTSPGSNRSHVSGGKSGRSGLAQKINSAGLREWLELVHMPDAVYLENRLPLLFASASSTIPKGYESFLKKLAQLVHDMDVRIIIDGYADTDPIHTDKYPSNLELGAARAAAVARFLEKQGVKPGVFKIGSTGEHRFDARKAFEWKSLQRHVNIRIFLRQGNRL